MKYAYVAAGLIAAVSAQSVADLPPCSLQCVITAVTGTGCSITDYACACPKSSQLTASVTPCVQSACTSTSDQEKVITVLSGICANAGFPITISATPSSGGSSSTASGSASASTTTTASVTESSTASSTATETSTTSATQTSVTVVTSTSSTAAGGSACSSSSVKTISTSITTVIPTVMYETVAIPCSTTVAPNSTSVAPTSAPSQVTAGAAANNVAFGAGFVALLAMAL